MISKKQLEQQSCCHLEMIPQHALADISSILIRQDLPQREKVFDFWEKVQNPYCFLCGEMPVKVCFAAHGPELALVLEEYFTRLKRG